MSFATQTPFLATRRCRRLPPARSATSGGIHVKSSPAVRMVFFRELPSVAGRRQVGCERKAVSTPPEER